MFFFFKQKTAYEMRISDWSSDVCSSDLAEASAVPAWRFNSSSHPEKHGGHSLGGRFQPPVRAGAVDQVGLVDQQPVAAMRHTHVFDKRVGLHKPVAHCLGQIAMQIGRASCRERECQYV